jgi:hypothetical protein
MVMISRLGKQIKRLFELYHSVSTTKSDVRSDCESLFRICLQHRLPINAPLVLISQIQRSGGTLLSQLFDGHPECHAHPYELHIGHQSTGKFIWPVLPLSDSPEQWFDILCELSAARLFQEGYHKYGPETSKESELFPFLFLPSLQKQIFLNWLATTEVTSERDVFDAYMTSYFNAWLNNYNMVGHKKIITAFRPGMATDAESVERFFNVYPDGKLLSVLRNPHSWYVSARQAKSVKIRYIDTGSSTVARLNGRARAFVRIPYANIEDAIDVWKESTQAMIRNKQHYGQRMCIIKFEDLIFQTEPAMRHIADYTGIDFDEILLTPTFNKYPIKANSSYSVKTHGIIHEPVARYIDMLENKEIETITSLAGDLYEKALKNTAPIVY